MARAHPIRIELSPDMSDLVESVVQSGDFQSPDEVVAAALNAWQAQRMVGNFSVEELDSLIQQGLDSGEPIDGEESFRRLRAEFVREFGVKA
ncbi:type II toxin-antitoxin system ParD family antitoxin [Rhizobium sp. SGZ-381]|uniref:ribbon-helix-helix domain-containing protein n=1 Tax=Rhizobium sp. SGZ-381 TaxID=3342800 RepID=UPI00366FAE0D